MTEKEIWMGRLMGYVEEMQKEWINICRPRFQEYYLLEMMLVSKHYWLIKWLVENDKIDLDMVREKLWIPCCVWYGSWRIIAVNDVEDYGQILMLLSISSSPIEDLLLYLK